MHRKGLWVALLILPTLLWVSLSYVPTIWWLENIIGIPSIITFGYALLFIILLLRRYYFYSLLALSLFFAWLYQSPPSNYSNQKCDDPLVIVQYNLYYTNPDLTPFLNYLKNHDIDLVVLQETAPWHGDQFMELIDKYPYQFGGTPGLGYPSGQMIISKQPLNLKAQNTPAGHYMISGVWQSSKHRPVSLYTAHPPSPRSEQLWHERNALIGSLERLSDYSPYADTLIIGDFNLSANTRRFTDAYQNYHTAPLQSWPREIKDLPIPSFSRIAIDHLWIRNTESPSLFICKREVLSQFSGSDHSAVVTYLSERQYKTNNK
ncbi:endonuclease/exonuclease/phosphatase family protein [Aliivibrio fischeri]|uniref:endonuclease/exonuclease/phosphatase family protein n=1 Tax=Aliivibrio fischeri TaxID=668 RepID=UPI0012D9EBA4|nr:endonuclease/exonuclease/phosphatase family protein [Aliivibrio fischeri]MUK28613.1 endonuclease/exonuclease/phosphatase family protein [Aliivibrio fischeri]MUK66731.1 endonuclease/exonuclease/phosphatase family protein [Aliivibrio fischeri]